MDMSISVRILKCDVSAPVVGYPKYGYSEEIESLLDWLDHATVAVVIREPESNASPVSVRLLPQDFHGGVNSP